MLLRNSHFVTAPKPYPSPGLWIDDDDDEDRELIINVQKNTRADGFGEKRISFIGGFCLLVNNITGPGMLCPLP
jgi:hypothetical protein